MSVSRKWQYRPLLRLYRKVKGPRGQGDDDG